MYENSFLIIILIILLLYLLFGGTSINEHFSCSELKQKKGTFCLTTTPAGQCATVPGGCTPICNQVGINRKYPLGWVRSGSHVDSEINQECNSFIKENNSNDTVTNSRGCENIGQKCRAPYITNAGDTNT